MKKIDLTKKYLTKHHVNLKKSTTQIAKENNCAQSTVIRWLTIFGIPRNGLQIEDLTGKQFGKWTVIKRAQNDKSGKVRWEVRCTCGNSYSVDAYTLKVSDSKGCRKCRLGKKQDNPFWTGCGELSGTIWGRIKNNAKYNSGRSHEKFVDINIKYAWNLYEKQERKCALSGLPIKFGSYSLKEETTASLDRIDSSHGYIKDNVQWVHKIVNKMKQDLNENEFLEFCKIIARYNS